ncbi:MAG TPA: ABC transporter ATP-binding protein [Candidatus Polarisedimenticolaceae bacterium]|nr:ABC transporter ATP-binding protein [Candidatus Polarisedimenticolaceae bacterium]
MSYAIDARDVAKSFVKKKSVRELFTKPLTRPERVHALRGVTLQVEEGEVFGLLGPNGAGKTTLLKILSCLVLPDSGTARIGGHDVVDEDEVKPKIGLVNSDERSFYWRLSGRENLRFFAELYDVPRSTREARIATLLERVDMVEAADRRFADYSSGMKQRLAIARAMLHDPPILFMDEPTRSLDPASALSLRAFILEELKARDGKTILIATHNLREAEAVCDRLAILVKGLVRQVGTVDEVRRWGVRERRLRLQVGSWRGLPPGPWRQASLKDLPDGGHEVEVALEDEGAFEDLLRALLASGVGVRACDRIEPDLEEAFSRILAREKEAAPEPQAVP